jgi:hypothetical protein
MAAAATSLSFTASAARRSVNASPSKCHRVEYLLMPKAIDGGFDAFVSPQALA